MCETSEGQSYGDVETVRPSYDARSSFSQIMLIGRLLICEFDRHKEVTTCQMSGGTDDACQYMHTGTINRALRVMKHPQY